jgi:hypothetical protein
METEDLTNIPEVFTNVNICRIIKVCKEAGVSKLKFGDLEVEFNQPVKRFGPEEKLAYQKPAQVIAAPESKANTNAPSAFDKTLHEDLRITQLMLEDPLAYEQMVIDAQINGGHMGAHEIGIQD